MTDQPSTILIAGPTASGKSALAAKVAAKLNGVVINADSMQVYRGLETLTACPSQAVIAAVPHRLYAFLPPDRPFSVGAWLKLAAGEARQAWKEGKAAVFAGGTGLYFTALLEGLAPVPEIPERLRRDLRKRAERDGVAALYAELERLDPQMADKLKPRDRQRIMRALEVVKATGASLLDWQRKTPRGLLEGHSPVKVCLTVPRDALEARIRKRFVKMLEAGALGEVRALKRRNLPARLPAMKALGLRPLMRHLAGELTRAQAIDQAVTETRRYAKRQTTWFKNRFKDWEFVPAGEGAEKAVLGLARDRIEV